MAGKGWKWYLGVGLFGYSIAALGLAALMPILFSAAAAATLATALIVSGEVGFWVSAALLGRDVFHSLKTKIKGVFVHATEPIQAVPSSAIHRGQRQ